MPDSNTPTTKSKDPPVAESSSDKSTKPRSQPPLQTAAKRLERLLGPDGGPTSGNSTNRRSTGMSVVEEANMSSHSNPSKIVKRWIGTSSRIASKATAGDISSAAKVLLDPMSACATGRDLLVQLETQLPPPARDDDDDDETMEDASAVKEEGEAAYLKASAREVEAWLLSLAVRALWNNSKEEDALSLATKAIAIVSTHLDEATGTASNQPGFVGSRGALYPLLARLYRYASLAMEKCGKTAVDGYKAEMSFAHRTAVLRRDVDTQATLLNLMLRDLLSDRQVEQAQKLLVNSTFPDSASNNQLCRYLYYSGRIQALRLEYTSAFSNLSQCLRKAPTNTAIGFRLAAQRLLIIVQLLMGEIPERNVFFTKGMTTELEPYLIITQAVRRGDLAVFRSTATSFRDRLLIDGTFTLISRLAHSVVKAGLRKLSTSYSRISLNDIATRLGLVSAASAEFVVAKAVRDGVIDATIDREGGYVQTHDLVDVYATTEPTDAFHRRIAYCLTTHNDALRSMRYPADAYKKDLEASRGLRGRKDDDKTDEEKAQELGDELEEDY